MGVDIDGGMIVGECFAKIMVPKDYDGEDYEWIEESEMDRMSMYYDANLEDNYIGFCVEAVSVSDIDDKWLVNVKALSDKFEKLTGVPARLIGTQNVW